MSFGTILPAYLRHLTASNVAIGALGALVAAGYSLPNLLFAPFTERIRQKKRLILWVTPAERFPYLILAGCAAWLAIPHPGLALGLTLATMFVFTCTGGALTPAWLDLIARAIPVRRRGAFFGRSNALAGVMGVGGAILAQHLLATERFPEAYVSLFLLAFVAVMVSYGFFALNLEQGPFPPPSAISLRSWFGGLPTLLRRDTNFAWYLASTLGGSLTYAVSAFFTVVAINRLQVGDYEVGWYTAVLLASSTAFNLVWGRLADARGHKLVLILGTLAMLIATPAALLVPSAGSYALVFALAGAGNAATALSRLAIMLEFAPAERRPTYVGLASLANAPLAVAGPLIGGVVADRIGYWPAFAIFWLAGLVTVALLTQRVQEPRRAPRSPAGSLGAG